VCSDLFLSLLFLCSFFDRKKQKYLFEESGLKFEIFCLFVCLKERNFDEKKCLSSIKKNLLERESSLNTPVHTRRSKSKTDYEEEDHERRIL